eukprot:746425-Hanusia_phi.AAC.5
MGLGGRAIVAGVVHAALVVAAALAEVVVVGGFHDEGRVALERRVRVVVEALEDHVDRLHPPFHPQHPHLTRVLLVVEHVVPQRGHKLRDGESACLACSSPSDLNVQRHVAVGRVVHVNVGDGEKREPAEGSEVVEGRGGRSTGERGDSRGVLEECHVSRAPDSLLVLVLHPVNVAAEALGVTEDVARHCDHRRIVDTDNADHDGAGGRGRVGALDVVPLVSEPLIRHPHQQIVLAVEVGVAHVDHVLLRENRLDLVAGREEGDGRLVDGTRQLVGADFVALGSEKGLLEAGVDRIVACCQILQEDDRKIVSAGRCSDGELALGYLHLDQKSPGGIGCAVTRQRRVALAHALPAQTPLIAGTAIHAEGIGAQVMGLRTSSEGFTPWEERLTLPCLAMSMASLESTSSIHKMLGVTVNSVSSSMSM